MGMPGRVGASSFVAPNLLLCAAHYGRARGCCYVRQLGKMTSVPADGW